MSNRKNWMDVAQEVLGSITSGQDEWLRRKVDVDCSDIRKMTTKEIKQRFPGRFKPVKNPQNPQNPQNPENPQNPNEPDNQDAGVNDARLIRTFIWQSYLMIKSDELEPMKGNMRTFWYRELGPFLKYHGLYEEDRFEGEKLPVEVAKIIEDDSRDDEARVKEFERAFKGQGRELYLLDKMSKSFDEFVLNSFFRFKGEFEFQDPREAFRIIGVKKPRYIFFTEKEGLFWFCKEIAKTYGISAVASHGEPGYLTMEYFSDALKAKGVRNVEIGALTDYDPWGYNIARTFGKKMKTPIFGFGVNTTFLTTLDLFTPYTIEHKKRFLGNVSDSKLSQVEEWVKKTGGINGEQYGIHVDNAEMDKVRDAIKNWLKQVGKKPWKL
ncbi:MAG: hypothetical protein ABRQ39_27965 [Candidatus Eremiobacterota bacterium]